MRKLLAFICILTLLISGCTAKEVSNETKNDPPSSESAQISSQLLDSSKDITFDDQEKVEQLIREYFSALEKKDYLTAWELTSTRRKEEYSKEEALKSHWGLESVKFISLKGYMTSEKSAVDSVPPNTPTICFIVSFDMLPVPHSAWNTGVNDRFVNVVKDNDGKWKIDGLATGP